MSGQCFLCGVDSSQLCPDCGDVFYCSEYHLSKHRVGNICLPFKIQICADKGRYVVATRDVEPLELLISDKAASIGPKQNTKPVCLGCLVPVTGAYSCPSCNYPMCSSECPNKEYHLENECSVFPRFPALKDYTIDQPQYECIVPLRLILNKMRDPDLWAIISMHMDHTEDRKQASPQLLLGESFRITGLCLQFCGLAELGYTEADLLYAASIISTHSVTHGARGRGFFPVFAFMSHSCTYNARHTTKGDRIEVYAQKKIEKGEEITITYTSLLSCTSHRQDKLRNLWFFTCSCDRCSDSTELGTYISSVLCPSCPKSGTLVMVSDESWSCNKCDLNIPCNMVINLLESTRSKMTTVHDTIQKHEQFLLDTKYILHPNNYQVLIVERILTQMYCKQVLDPYFDLEDDISTLMLKPVLCKKEDALRKLELCDHLIRIITILDAGFSQFYGLTLFEKASALFILYSMQQPATMNSENSTTMNSENVATMDMKNTEAVNNQTLQMKNDSLDPKDIKSLSALSFKVENPSNLITLHDILASLETCIKCLSIEPENCHSGKVCNRARSFTKLLIKLQ